MEQRILLDTNFPVGSAAGWCKDIEGVRQLAQSAASFIVVGSYTNEPREGNPGNTFNGLSDFSLNSLGMPNRGRTFLHEHGREMVEVAHQHGKPIYLSAAGFTPEEYILLACVGYYLCFDGVELNLGCPNVVDGGRRKAIASFDLGVVREILTELHVRPAETLLTVKVSPMTNPHNIIDLAELLAQYQVNAVVTMNTLPNCLDFDDAHNHPTIQTPDGTGWAGGAGKHVLPIALGQINQWRKALPEHIQVWGAGGAQDGQSVRKMLMAGASVVQVGTGLFVYGPKIFSDIASEFI